MICLEDALEFPNPLLANEDGLLAYGGDLSWQRLLLAYQSGIFPWYNEGEPILWWCPESRFVLFPSKLRVSKSMKKLFDKETFKVTENKNFTYVISQCAERKRKGQQGTWINQKMQMAYIEMHKRGYAKSVEVWNAQGNCVGGFYGIDLGGIFCGESMFALENNASKYAFIYFVKKYETKYTLIDCQVYTKHLESLGAENLEREKFLNIIKQRGIL